MPVRAFRQLPEADPPGDGPCHGHGGGVGEGEHAVARGKVPTAVLKCHHSILYIRRSSCAWETFMWRNVIVIFDFERDN